MKKLIFCFFLLMPLLVLGQEFKGAALWDAQGEIKELKYTTENPIMKPKKIKFDKNGKLAKAMIVYSEKGYPEGMDMNFGPMKTTMKFEFNQDNLLQKVNVETNIGMTGCLTSWFEYDKIIMTSQVIEGRTEEGDATKKFEFSFSEYLYDDNGNWISRSVKMKMTDFKKNKTEEKTYTETRAITYW